MSGYTRYQLRAGICTHEQFFRCELCPEDGYGPVVLYSVWREVVRGLPKQRKPRFICQSCMERRLGRSLVRDDLRECPLTESTWVAA